MTEFIHALACLVESADPFIRIVLSLPTLPPFPCFSTSICAPESSRIALILLPPLPITREMAFALTTTFLDFLTTSFHPASSTTPDVFLLLPGFVPEFPPPLVGPPLRGLLAVVRLFGALSNCFVPVEAPTLE